MASSGRGDRRPTRLSLETKLPLLVTALIAAVVIAVAVASWSEVRRSAELAAEARVSAIAGRLSDLMSNSVEQRLDLLEEVAGSGPVVGYLRGRESAREDALARLETLRVPADTGLPIQLWGPDRRPVLEVRSGAQVSPEPGFVPNATASVVPDSGGYGPFFLVDGVPHYWTATPVESGGRRVGWVAQLRSFRGAQSSAIQDLIGGEYEFLLANRDQPIWLTLEADSVPAPAGWPFVGAREYRRDGTRYVAHARPVEGAGFSVVAELPRAVAMQRPQAFLRWVALISLLLVAAGAVAAKLVLGGVTAPLVRLDAAARGIARGDLDQRVDIDRSDELGALAGSFNHMAAQLREARTALERQFAEARALAAELSDANARLEDAIRAADHSRVEAQRASRAKSDFLATMSHEIRTPINAMLGYTDLLDVGVAGPLTEAQREHLSRIRASGRHLVGLIDEVLDLSGVESGRLRLEPRNAPLDEAAETALAIVRPQALSKPVVLELERRDEGVVYAGDPRRVEQILVNLLTNAVKFTPRGGRVRVSSGAAVDEGGRWAEVIVEDSGIGIEPDLQERIFEPFVQAESGYTRAHGGVGLGLSISRRLARMMGGDITVRSSPGQGARFRLRLPAGVPEHARA